MQAGRLCLPSCTSRQSLWIGIPRLYLGTRKNRTARTPLVSQAGPGNEGIGNFPKEGVWREG